MPHTRYYSEQSSMGSNATEKSCLPIEDLAIDETA